MRCRSLSSFRAKPIASCIATFWGLSFADAALGVTTHYVTSCSDNGPGTLRSILADVGTLTGDTVDLSNVAPCTISLEFIIFVDQDDLTIQAPAGKPVLLKGDGSHQVLRHRGAGQTTFDYIDFTSGHDASKYVGRGGCIYSTGSVEVRHGSISDCSAQSEPASDPPNGVASAYGGAIYARGRVTLTHSTISGSHASILGYYASQFFPHYASGGAIYSRGGVVMEYSTVSGNQAGGAEANCGGINTLGNLTMMHSTISGNSATGSGGGLCAGGKNATYAHIFSSTISGNTADATFAVGGAALSAPDVVIANSTIAFNSGAVVAGLFLSETANAKLQSTIVSNNSTSTGDVDFGVGGIVTPTFDAATSNNFIRVPENSTPPGTTTGVCPKLGPLRDNGGPTQTHALASDSLLIDAGSNPNGEETDQRGDSILYPRSSGIGPDAGAYEENHDDVIFVTFFEGCN